MLKINLGSGNKKYEGFLNLDKFEYFQPDIVHDLEIFPYPFKDNEIEEIRMIHVLEHIGKDSETFNKIINKNGKVKKFDFKPLSHYEIGNMLKLMDFDQASKTTASRFVFLKDELALLERAISNFMIDVALGHPRSR